MAKITVMMAAYNVEPYLARALDSILVQTFRDFDVIIVNDGSSDATGDICDEYAGKDSRIHVIHQKKSGVCITRNSCLDWASQCSDSQWIIFVDSDDWIHPEMLERMLRAAEENHVRICACGYQATTGEEPVIDPKTLVPEVWKTMDFYMTHYTNAIMACCKLYEKSCYGSVRHPVKNCGYDDEFATHQVLYGEEYMVVIPAPLYAYYTNPQSLTKNDWSPRMLQAWDAYEEQLLFFRERGETELVNFRYRGYLENALDNYRRASEAPDEPEILAARKRIYKKIRQLIRRMRRQECLDYRLDFDVILAFYPLRTRIYRLARETWERLRGGQNA